MRYKTLEMTVWLKMPDTTAITDLQTLHNIGIKSVKDLKRADYYKFYFEGDEDAFRQKISKIDILVNANKHYVSFGMQKDAQDSAARLLVKNTDENAGGILSVLKNRLGFSNIKKIEKATLWELKTEGSEKDAIKIADRAAKELLVNEHYQQYSILQKVT